MASFPESLRLGAVCLPRTEVCAAALRNWESLQKYISVKDAAKKEKKKKKVLALSCGISMEVGDEENGGECRDGVDKDNRNGNTKAQKKRGG